ncbi:MAG TPA: hypothetical protein VGI78_16800 [Acetobacteraceae bacterium]
MITMQSFLRDAAAGVLALSLSAVLSGCAPPAQPPAANVSQFDGDYSGSMTGLPGHDVGCRPTMKVEGMHVSGGHVSFGSFSGTIGIDGMLQMETRFEWITGQFTGNRFSGRVQPQREGCGYQMELARTG